MSNQYLSGGDKLQQALRDLADKLSDGGEVQVGFFPDATYPDGTSVALVASIQEFGALSRGIPPRPFFRNAIADHGGEWADEIGPLLQSTGYDTTKTLRLMGKIMVADVQQSIIDLTDPPLTPATIKRKGFDTPLIDTGQMLKSVKAVVSGEEA